MEAPKQHLLFITRKWTPGVGGMETYSVKFVEHMQKHFHVTVLKPTTNITGRPTTCALLWFLLKATTYVLLNSRKFSIIHLGDGVLYPLSFVSRLFKVKTFITFHGLDIQLSSQPTFLGKVYKAYMSLLAYAPISCAFPNSKYTGSLLPKSLPTKVMTLGTDLPLSTPKLGGLKQFNIVYVGRLIERKGIFWFIDNILPQLTNVTLTIIGPLPKTLDAGKITAAHPNIRFTGALIGEELHKERELADLFIVPNITTPVGDGEGFGLVCVENATYGVPVLVSDWQGLKDAVIDGVTGYLLPPEDVNAWASKIKLITEWSVQEKLGYASKLQKNMGTYIWNSCFISVINTYFSTNRTQD
jgi:phosphatidyl-myo-inositol dimannoside synthase